MRPKIGEAKRSLGAIPYVFCRWDRSGSCEDSHSLGLWCSPRRTSEVTANDSAVTLARRGAPGDSNDLEALVLAWLFPYILRSCSPTLLG